MATESEGGLAKEPEMIEKAEKKPRKKRSGSRYMVLAVTDDEKTLEVLVEDCATVKKAEEEALKSLSEAQDEEEIFIVCIRRRVVMRKAITWVKEKVK